MHSLKKETPAVILLNETWLKNNYKFSINSYNTIREDCNDGYGEVATCIRINICFNKLKDFNSDYIKYLVTKIDYFTIINIYSSTNNQITKDFLEEITNNVSDNNIVIMGDFNFNHFLWDKTIINKSEKVTSDFIAEKKLGHHERWNGNSFTKPKQQVKCTRDYHH